MCKNQLSKWSLLLYTHSNFIPLLECWHELCCKYLSAPRLFTTMFSLDVGPTYTTRQAVIVTLPRESIRPIHILKAVSNM